MARQNFVFFIALALCTLWTTEAQRPGPCMEGLMNDITTKCFDQNGVEFKGFLFVISQNRTGQLPAGVSFQEFIDNVCLPTTKDKTIPCLLKQVQKWNQTNCAAQDRQMMLQQAAQFNMYLEGVCGDQCEQTAMQSMVQCFATAGIDMSTVLNPQITIVADKYGIIGSDAASVNGFCSSRQGLFDCVRPLLTSCPSFAKRLYPGGVDLLGLEKATAQSCSNTKEYLESLTCFQKESTSVSQCRQDHEKEFVQVQEGRFMYGDVLPSTFQARLCRLKLGEVECEVKNHAQTCGGATAELLRSFECTSLPQPCREDADIQDLYNRVCNPAPQTTTTTTTTTTTLPPTTPQAPTPAPTSTEAPTTQSVQNPTTPSSTSGPSNPSATNGLPVPPPPSSVSSGDRFQNPDINIPARFRRPVAAAASKAAAADSNLAAVQNLPEGMGKEGVVLVSHHMLVLCAPGQTSCKMLSSWWTAQDQGQTGLNSARMVFIDQ